MTEAAVEEAIVQHRANVRDSLLRAERELTAIRRAVYQLQDLGDADAETDLIDHSLNQVAVGMAAIQHATRYLTTTTNP